jgi:hypothetical protein
MAVTPQDNTIFTLNSGDDIDYVYAAASGATNHSLTDVSGNGVSLFKGTLDGNEKITGSHTVATEAPYCFDFDLTFSVSNSEEAMAIFLSSDSSIIATDDQEDDDVALSKSMRVAILNSAETTSLAYYAPHEASTTQIITAGSASYYTQAGLSSDPAVATDLALTNTQNVLLDGYTDGSTDDYTDATNTTTAIANGYLGTVAAGVDATFEVTARIWLEGTDADCTNTAQSGNVAVNLVFNGVSNIVA